MSPNKKAGEEFEISLADKRLRLPPIITALKWMWFTTLVECFSLCLSLCLCLKHTQACACVLSGEEKKRKQWGQQFCAIVLYSGIKVAANYVQSCWFMFSLSVHGNWTCGRRFTRLWVYVPEIICRSTLWLCCSRACQRWSAGIQLDFTCLTAGSTCGRRSGHKSSEADWLLLAVFCGDCVINAESQRVFSRSRLPLMFYWLWPWKGPSNEEQDAGGGGGGVGWVGAGVGGKFLQSKRGREKRAEPGTRHQAVGTYTAEHLPVQYTHTNCNYVVIFF